MATLEEVEQWFDKYDDEFLKFERITNPRSQRSDLHAFLVLDELFPGKYDIVSAAEHDKIWLDPEPAAFAEKATEELVLELVRCGVMWEDLEMGLCMFC